MIKKLVQQQFGKSAEAYVTSMVHAKGASLERLVELVEPQGDWSVLDVATATGHTAYTFARHVALVVASDITYEMLTVAARQAQEREVENVILASADAEALPFESGRFDLVTCRIAPHHFPDIGQFVIEAARVLCPQGLLAVVDNVVPGGFRRGKKAQRQRDAGRYINAFEKLRDPSHERCLSLDEWQQHFYQAGFRLLHQETNPKKMAFFNWASRMQVAPDNMIRLRAMLQQAPAEVAEFLQPEIKGDNISFSLTEAIFIGQLFLDAPRPGG